jgi:hypothetical protein
VNDQLARIVTSLDGASRRLHGLAGRLIPAQAADRRGSARWSVAEHLAHLNLTSEAFLPLIDNGLLEAGQLGGEVRRYRQDLMGWLLSLVVGPQKRIFGLRIMSVRTSPRFVPHDVRPFPEVLAAFDRLQGRLVSLVRAADGLPIDQIYVESPFDGRVRYNVYSAFIIIPRHQLRHVVHAEALWPVAGKE